MVDEWRMNELENVCKHVIFDLSLAAAAGSRQDRMTVTKLDKSRFCLARRGAVRAAVAPLRASSVPVARTAGRGV